MPHVDTDRRFSWTRYVTLAGVQPTLADGFLYVVPRDDKLRPVGEIEDEVTLLLGEPGIGKTDILSQIADIDRLFLPAVALDRRNGVEHLRSELSTGSVSVLIVDGLDEHPGGPMSALDALARSGVFSASCRVWLSCRTSDWNTATKERLVALTARPSRSLGIYEVAPLQFGDIRQAALSCGIDVEAFLRQIHQLKAKALANRPLTLGLLLSVFQSGEFPQRRSDLFEVGCAALCGDNHTLLVASRIAAWTVFTQRPWIEHDDVAYVDLTLKIGQLTGREPLLGQDGYIRPSDVRVVCGTGLLTSFSGGHRWAHPSFAEFLAARYVAKLDPDPTLVQSLFAHTDGAVVPQLSACAGWATSLFEGDARDVLVSLSPFAQLQGDLDQRSSAEKATVAVAVLERIEQGYGDSYEQRSNYWKLDHAGLEAILRPYILDASRDRIARRAAIEIAGANRVLSAELMNLVGDTAEDVHLRRHALRAADVQEPQKLRPLLQLAPEDDYKDDLRSGALRALWDSGQLSPRELFERLGGLRNTHYYGNWAKLADHIARSPERWLPEALAPAIDWYLRTSDVDTLEFLYSDDHGAPIFKAALSFAAAHLDEPNIEDILLGLINRTKRSYIAQLNNQLTLSCNWAEYWRICTDAQLEPALLLAQATDLNFDVIIEPLAIEEDPTVRNWLFRLAQMAGVWSGTPGVERLVHLYQIQPEKYALFAPLCQVELGSDLAHELRDNWTQQQNARERWARRRSTEHSQHSQINPVEDPDAWITDALGRLRNGKLEWFPELLRRLSLEPGATHYGRHWHNVEGTYGWKNAAPARRQEIAHYARKFLELPPETTEWFFGSSLPFRATAAVVALNLVTGLGHAQEPIPPPIFKRWLPAIVHNASWCELNTVVREAISKHADAEFRDLMFQWSVSDAIDLSSMRLRYRTLSDYLPSFIAALAESVLSERTLDPEKRGVAARYLLQNDPTKSAVVLEELNAEQKETRWAQLASGALLGAPAIIWPSIKKRILRLPTRAVLGVLGTASEGGSRSSSFVDLLTTAEVGEILQWLDANIPKEGTYGVTVGFHPDRFRQTVLEVLVARASPEAAKVLRGAGHRWAADTVEAGVRSKSWRPLSPTAVARLLHDRKSVRLNTIKQLSTWVESSVHEALRGSVGRALWTRAAKERWLPVEDSTIFQAIADVVAVIKKRIVDGDCSVDLDHRSVTARFFRGDLTLSHSIEVRPNWHPRLLDRPTKADTAVVVWFGGAAWTRRWDVDRRRQTQRWDQEEVSEALLGRGFVARVASPDQGLPPFAAALADALKREGVEPDGWVSLGDRSTWFAHATLPLAMRERFGLAPKASLIVAEGGLSESAVRVAQGELAFAEADVDFNLLITVAEHATTIVKRMRGGIRQLVPWDAPVFSNLEQTLVQHLPTFDVFDERGAVRGSRLLCREAEVADLARRIQTGAFIVVAGMRKVGKSSLLLGVQDLLMPTDGRTLVRMANVDLQEVSGRTEASLATAISKSLGADSLATFAALLAYLTAQMEQTRRFCIVLDEFDLLFEGQAVWPGVDTLLRGLRALADKWPGQLSVVFIGRKPSRLEAPLLGGYPNPILARATHYWVAPFSRAKSDEVLQSLGRRVALTFDDHALETAYEWTGGHAMLLRQFGSAALKVCRSQGIGDTGLADTEEILDTFVDLDLPEVIYDEIQDLLTEEFPRASALLEDLLSEAPSALERNGGRRGKAAVTLRHLGLLVGRPPHIPQTLFHYHADTNPNEGAA